MFFSTVAPLPVARTDRHNDVTCARSRPCPSAPFSVVGNAPPFPPVLPGLAHTAALSNTHLTRYMHLHSSSPKGWLGLLCLPRSIYSFAVPNLPADTRGGITTLRSCPITTTMSMTDPSEVRASPTWEDKWSGGISKGDMWDTGVVSPALQKLLDEGETICSD